MSMYHPESHSEGVPRFSRIVFVYLAGGPPIGGTYLILGVLVYGLASGRAFDTGRLSNIVPLWLFTVLFSYFIGGVYAFLTGLIVGAWSAFAKRMMIAAALTGPCIALLPGAAGILTPTHLFGWSHGSGWEYKGIQWIMSGNDLSGLIVYLIVGVASSLTCWWVLQPSRKETR